MNATYIRIDLIRQLRDFGNITFVIAMPVVMYMIFGASFSMGDEMFGNGNIKFYTMVSMASYGAALAATSVAGTAAIEQMQGWGRQVGLTPVTNRSVVAMKVVVALIVTTFEITILFIAGLLTGAKADSPAIWISSFLIILGGATLYALFGFAVAMHFKSESALSVATGVLVLMAFLGNVFMPLTGTMLQMAHFTPLYGYVGLARWPQIEGALAPPAEGFDEMWMLLANFVGWFIVFAAVAVVSVRNGRSRQ
ncbi:ABC transporter permease [Timonella sp. A28]|uniref:ABC transporter permease n=1 Tax=Timonella sp. A28 TaxID=3442640 RepID=UPI003EB97005